MSQCALVFLKLLCQVTIFQVFAEHLKWAYVEGVAVLLHVLHLGMAGGSAKIHNWKLPILCTGYHNLRMYNIRTYCLCHGTLSVQPVYRLALVVYEGAYIW